MLAVALSVLFGLIAFAALALVHGSIRVGIRRGRRIMAELSVCERQERTPVKAKSARHLYQPAWQLQPAAA